MCVCTHGHLVFEIPFLTGSEVSCIIELCFFSLKDLFLFVCMVV